jgi:hypothetical protein
MLTPRCLTAGVQWIRGIAGYRLIATSPLERILGVMRPELVVRKMRNLYIPCGRNAGNFNVKQVAQCSYRTHNFCVRCLGRR